MTAQWKDIPGLPEYEASDAGQIRRKGKDVPLNPVRVGAKRCQYWAVYAGGGRNGRKRPVHRLVALAFHGLPQEGFMACHRDGDRNNNSAANIYWGTPSENTLDSMRHGTFVPMRGDKNGNSSLALDDVLEIKRRYTGRRGEQSRLAREFNVSVTTVHNIVHARTWFEVSP